MKDQSDDRDHSKTVKRKCVVVFLTLLLMIGGVAIALVARFAADVPADYADAEAHFKYGSTGGERASGFPYWIWKVLPTICEKELPGGKNFPGQELKAVGFLYEGDNDLPIGMSKRRHMGLDRVFLNCAVCHTSTVRDKPESNPRIITGMPANTVDLMAFEKFLFACAKDAKFSPEHIIPEIHRLSGEHLKALDRYLVYPFAIYMMRDRLLMLEDRFSSMLQRPEWGPGRVDTFGSAKALFNFPMDKAPASEVIGVTDFPSIWLQGPRIGMQLHWDGNNTKVEERNRSAAFGTGATPATLDRERIKRIEDWLLTREPPGYPYPNNPTLSGKGAVIYRQYCAGCHGVNGRNFEGQEVGKVTLIQQINTDPHRLDSYTYDLAVNQNLLYAETDDPKERFSHFRKHSVTRTCPWMGCGSALPICTTAPCRRSGIYSNQARDGRRRFIVAMTSMIKPRSGLSRHAMKRMADSISSLIRRLPAIPTAGMKASRMEPTCRRARRRRWSSI